MKFIKYFPFLFVFAVTVLSCSKKADVEPTPEIPVEEPAMGKSYAGGIVFYLDSTGKHGLAAATSDQTYAAEWGCEGTLVMANGTALSSGHQNTNTIVGACVTPGIAARLCDAVT